MLNVEGIVNERFPGLHQRSPILAKPFTNFLKMLFHEKDFQSFERKYPHLKGLDFVEQVLQQFDFSYSVRDNERERIPSSGRVVIIANHPIGSLDGLALLKLVSKVRKDVKVVANDLLLTLEPLHSLLLPVDNMNGNTVKQNIRNIRQYLESDGALIIFPAGEVSRMSPKGIKDGKWQNGFLKIATATQSPILPIHVDGRNSSFFYSLSMISKPLSTLWLIREMFKQMSNSVSIRIGEIVPYGSYNKLQLPTRTKTKLFRKHLYRIGKEKPGCFKTETAIAHPEERWILRKEISQCELLGETRDNKKIYLYHYTPDSSIMREIGRLREVAFRAVGEGSGRRRDHDCYDQHYMHLILWDEEEIEIVGAYRLCDTAKEVKNGDINKLYTASLFDYHAIPEKYLRQGLELGRSFVQPRYWGKRSLDYLWYGIGALLKRNPHFRYLFGPVTISDRYSKITKEMLVYFYQLHFGSEQKFVTAKTPFQISQDSKQQLELLFIGEDYKRDFTVLKEQLSMLGYTVPTLYKQYTEVCQEGGVEFLAFNIDPEFSDCVDSFVLVDTEQLVPNKRKRYMSETGNGR